MSEKRSDMPVCHGSESSERSPATGASEWYASHWGRLLGLLVVGVIALHLFLPDAFPNHAFYEYLREGMDDLRSMLQDYAAANDGVYPEESNPFAREGLFIARYDLEGLSFIDCWVGAGQYREMLSNLVERKGRYPTQEEFDKKHADRKRRGSEDVAAPRFFLDNIDLCVSPSGYLYYGVDGWILSYHMVPFRYENRRNRTADYGGSPIRGLTGKLASMEVSDEVFLFSHGAQAMILRDRLPVYIARALAILMLAILMASLWLKRRSGRPRRRPGAQLMILDTVVLVLVTGTLCLVLFAEMEDEGGRHIIPIEEYCTRSVLDASMKLLSRDREAGLQSQEELAQRAAILSEARRAWSPSRYPAEDSEESGSNDE